ncbi:hypothetical protein PCE1_004621 [Barthelona sp. PCE]
MQGFTANEGPDTTYKSRKATNLTKNLYFAAEPATKVQRTRRRQQKVTTVPEDVTFEDESASGRRTRRKKIGYGDEFAFLFDDTKEEEDSDPEYRFEDEPPRRGRRRRKKATTNISLRNRDRTRNSSAIQHQQDIDAFFDDINRLEEEAKIKKDQEERERGVDLLQQYNIERVLGHRDVDDYDVPVFSTVLEPYMDEYEEGTFEHEIADVLDDVVEQSIRYNPEFLEPVTTKKGSVRLYMCKWRHYAHFHNAEFPYELLRFCPNHEKIGKYEEELEKEKVMLETSDPDVVESYLVQKEKKEDLIKSHQVVERVLSHDPVSGTVVILWRGLDYSHATFEVENIPAINFVKEYNKYYSRINNPPKALRVAKDIREIILSQHSICQQTYPHLKDRNLLLRDYQQVGVDFLLRSHMQNRNVILADEPGLGKTIQTTMYLQILKDACNVRGPHIIIVPLVTLLNWKEELERWGRDFDIVVYQGQKRELIRQYEVYKNKQNYNHPSFEIMLTTYEYFKKDHKDLFPPRWKYHHIIIDEAHVLKSKDSQLFNIMKDFRGSYLNVLLLTGTPLQNNLEELYNLLYIVKYDHQRYNFNRFYKKFPIDDFKSANIEVVQNLKNELKTYILQRRKKQVEKSLPTKNEKILSVPLTMEQKRIYLSVVYQNYGELSKVTTKRPSLVSIMARLKSICNHSFLINNHTEDLGAETDFQVLLRHSGKLKLLDDLLNRLKAEGRRVLLFSQMIRMIHLLQVFCRYKNYAYQTITGGVKGRARQDAIDAFNAPNSTDFIFLITTKAGGVGINLHTADTVIIYDSDWNPQNDIQALSRAHRIGQKKQVSVFRLVSKDTVEEQVLMRAKSKLVLEHLVMQTKEDMFTTNEIRDVMKLGTVNLFEKDDSDAIDVDHILATATEETNDEDNSAKADLFNSFSVVDVNLEDKDFYDKYVPDEFKVEHIQDELTVDGLNYVVPVQHRRKRSVNYDSILRAFRFFPSFDRIQDIANNAKFFDTAAITQFLSKFLTYCESKLEDSEFLFKEGVKMAKHNHKQLVKDFQAADIIRRFYYYNSLSHYVSDGVVELPKEFPKYSASTDWTPEHDEYIMAGIIKHGYSMWANILKDPEYSFPDDIASPQIGRRAVYIMRDIYRLEYKNGLAMILFETDYGGDEMESVESDSEIEDDGILTYDQKIAVMERNISDRKRIMKKKALPDYIQEILEKDELSRKDLTKLFRSELKQIDLLNNNAVVKHLATHIEYLVESDIHHQHFSTLWEFVSKRGSRDFDEMLEIAYGSDVISTEISAKHEE